ncbi:Translin [Syncephalis fuscata]|nr:Translin [Syncephalis fuscata]
MTTTVSVKDTFEVIRATLDTHHDRRERLVKCSRDITVASKRLIFALHRMLAEQSAESITTKTQSSCDDIMKLFKKISDELAHSNFHCYERSITPALEEFIEGMACRVYLTENRLVTLDELRELFEKAECQHILLTEMTYLLGLADFTGELMRMAINAIAAGERTIALKACNFLRPIVLGFDALMLDRHSVHSLKQKMETMHTSMDKVERACCSLSIRELEVIKQHNME